MLPAEFQVARYRFQLRARAPISLAAVAGSTLRGAFGIVFRRLVCVTRMPTCQGCLLRDQCAYGYLFETRPPADSERLRKLQDIPRPFVICPHGPTRIESGELLDFDLTLIGRAIPYLPYFVFVFGELGQRGLGKGRGQFDLARVDAVTPEGDSHCIFNGDGRLLDSAGARWETAQLDRDDPGTTSARLTLETPLRLHSEGKLVRRLQFHQIVRGLLRRLSSLCYFHCRRELDLDYRGLIAAAESVRVRAHDLRWIEQTRYSSRQQSELQMGGLLGSLDLEGPLGTFLPLLRAGELVHVGKGCVMGMGRYRVEVANEEN